MHIIDAHFHYWPRPFFERLCGRTTGPRAERNERGGYRYWRHEGGKPDFDVSGTWFELDEMLERMDHLEHRVSVVSSIGALSPHFSDLPPELGRDDAMAWNEELAATQRRYPGRIWGSAAIPLGDTAVALEVLEHAVTDLGLVGVNVPGSIGDRGRIDHERLEPLYDRIEELGVVLFLHPTDTLFNEILEGYDDALYLGLGRVIDVSVSAARLIYSGIMDRHPDLKVYMSHSGGALPYQAGRMDKGNSRGVRLPQPVSTYMKRMYTDVVTPHTAGMKFAIEYHGADHVMYGSDYPCWNPETALQMLDAVGLSTEDRQRILADNAARLFGLATDATARLNVGAAARA